MKKLIPLLLLLLTLACNKSQDTSTPALTPVPVMTHSVLYKFTSTVATVHDFELSFMDVAGSKTLKDQSTGWTYSLTLDAGSYVWLSALAHTPNVPATVQIYCDNVFLKEQTITGAGTYAYASVSATLP